MASESVCRSCGATAGYDHRTRCDGCGKLFDPHLKPGSRDTSLSLPGATNRFDLCAGCEERILAVVGDALLRCGRCGHFRPEHNAGCMRTLGPSPDFAGALRCCDCPGWVTPNKETV